jgi:spore maturation protein CgeB
MKILYCDTLYYYNIPGTLSMTYEYFAKTLRELGHDVHFFNYVAEALVDRDAMNDFFLSVIKNGGYDLAWVTLTNNEFKPEILDEARRYCVLFAWNSDDDVRWADYSALWYPHFTYMATTYRNIFDTFKPSFPNLLLSAWGCTGRYDGLHLSKDINFSFVGRIYPNRAQEIVYIRRRQKIKLFGMGELPGIKFRIKRWTAKKLGIPWNPNKYALATESEVKGIWNRTRVSFTPLTAWISDNLQVKARVFDMGLSGTVMLCNKNPALYEYYDPGKEYVEYGDLDECVSKASYLLAHESERLKIASAYYHRTRSEHMWENRFSQLFAQMGLA